MNKKVKDLAMHDSDTGSSEIQIALLTEKIENLSKHIKQFKKDKHSSVGLLKAVNRRKRLLDYIKRNKLYSYKNVLSKLSLIKYSKYLFFIGVYSLIPLVEITEASTPSPDVPLIKPRHVHFFCIFLFIYNNFCIIVA